MEKEIRWKGMGMYLQQKTNGRSRGEAMASEANMWRLPLKYPRVFNPKDYKEQRA